MMRKTLFPSICAAVVLALLVDVPLSGAQEDQEGQARSTHTMRPLITGRRYAASSMKPQATEAAVRMLEAGGNAFDAAVAGQAVLALVDPSLNGRAA